MTKRAISRDCRHAEDTAERAVGLRYVLRWRSKPGTPQREAKIASMLDDIAEAMKPLRSYAGKATYDLIPEDCVPRVHRASQALQHQAAALRRMRRR